MPSEKREKLLKIINNETDRLARLINDILDLTKIEAGKLSWHITRVSLNEWSRPRSPASSPLRTTRA